MIPFFYLIILIIACFKTDAGGNETARDTPYNNKYQQINAK